MTSRHPYPFHQLAILLVFATIAAVFWGSFADDAFIVARYAANVLQGHGLVYNPGERINVLTSPLHALVLVPIQALFPNAIKAYTVLSGLAIAALMFWAAPRLFASPTKALYFLAIALLFPPLVFWSIGGLETPLLTAWLILACVAWAGVDTLHSRIALLVLAALCVLTRYDAVLLVAPLSLYVLVQVRHETRIWLTVAALAAVLVLWFAGSFWYFGDLLPNSFHTKPLSNALGQRVQRGTVYALSFAVLLFLPLALACLLGKKHDTAAIERDPPARPVWPVWIGLLLYGCYGLLAGTVHMMYLYRLFVPCAPLLTWAVLAHLPAAPRPAGIWLVLALQLGLAAVVSERSLNFNLSLLWTSQSASSGNEWYEFSLAGARQSSKYANRVLEQQAQELVAHWQQHGRPHEQPRISLFTEGQPPYHLPHFYVYGPLVSYRHRCRVETPPSAHYWQATIYLRPDSPPPVYEPGWELVTTRDVAIRDWDGKRSVIRLQWFYQPQPQPHRLPDTVDAPCLDISTAAANS